MTSHPADNPPDDSRPADLVVVGTFPDVTAAEVAAADLQSRGIACSIRSDDCGGMLPPMGMVQLAVAAAEAEEARALLATRVLADPRPSSDERTFPRGFPAFGFFLLGLALGAFGYGVVQHFSQSGVRTFSYDNNHDGRPDEFHTMRNGINFQTTQDRNSDGAIDAWTAYDDTGLIKSYSEDNNFDGEPDSCWTYANGTASELQQDMDFNRRSDVISFLTNGVVGLSEWRPNGADRVSLRQFFHLGVLTREWHDTNADGRFDVEIIYGPFQNVVSSAPLAPLELVTQP